MVRFGMCGCGDFIESVVLPLMLNVENAEAVAAFDVNGLQMERVCSEFHIEQACSTYEELLNADGVDAIYIASPNVFHREQVIAAAEAGKHVFCQKPLALNADDCREMVKTCQDWGVKLGVGFCYRFQGAQQEAKRLIREGAIGEVSYMHLSFNLGGYSPETVGWRCDPKMSGGGPLMDLAPHLVDLACFFLDDEVESVMAYVRPEKTEAQIETDVLAMLQFRGGARAAIDTSFVRGNCHNYNVAGTKGEIRAVGTMVQRTAGTVTLQTDDRQESVPFSNVEHVEEEMRLYSIAIENDEELPVPGEAGLRAQAVIDAIFESGRSGKRCEVRACHPAMEA